MRPKTSAATSVLLGIVVVVLSIAKPVCLGFSPPSAFGARTTHYLASTKTKEPTTKEVAEEDGVDDDDDRISELDARVLQSMLRDDKLDLGIEQNMRKLLERGIAPKSAPKVPKDTQQQDNDEEGEYASQILKTLTDSDLWRSFKAKADDLAESAKIYVSNRIERDFKLLASVGLFAIDRIQKDVARALPASSNAIKTAVLRLSNSSSYDENVASSSSASMREELTTPMDEFKSVSRALQGILSGESVESVSSSSSQRGLRNAAPAGQRNAALRQQRAYQRRQETTLKKKSALDDVGGLAGGLTDAAWELKREMEVETSRPGYRSEGVRNAISAGAEQAVQALQAARDEPDGWKRLILGEPKNKKTTPPELPSAEVVANGGDMPGYRDIQFEPVNGDDTDTEAINGDAINGNAVNGNAVNGDAVNGDAINGNAVNGDAINGDAINGNAVNGNAVNGDIVNGAADLENVVDVEAEATVNANGDAKDFDVPEGTVLLSVDEGDVGVLIPVELLNEKTNVIGRLQECIRHPEDTWLATDDEDDAFVAGSNSVTQVVSYMMEFRNQLERDDDQTETTAVNVIRDLREIKARIDAVVSLAEAAGGPAVARKLSLKLYGTDLQAGVQPTLMVLDEIAALISDAASDAALALESMTPDAVETPQPEDEEDDEFVQDFFMSTMSEPEPVAATVVEIEPEPVIKEVEAVVVDTDVIRESKTEKAVPQDVVVTEVVAEIATEVETEVVPTNGVVVEDDDDFNMVSAAAEIVSDSDFDKAVGEAKTVEAVPETGGALVREDNAILQATLRSLDVGFFVTEKVLTVGVPAVVDASVTAGKRIDDASRGGLGKKGWKRLGNTKSGSRRY